MNNIKEIKSAVESMEKLIDNVQPEDLFYQGLGLLPDLVDDMSNLIEKEVGIKRKIERAMIGNLGKDYSLQGRPDPNAMLYALKMIGEILKE